MPTTRRLGGDCQSMPYLREMEEALGGCVGVGVCVSVCVSVGGVGVLSIVNFHRERAVDFACDRHGILPRPCRSLLRVAIVPPLTEPRELRQRAAPWATWTSKPNCYGC